jgi:uncharacterized membrane protein
VFSRVRATENTPPLYYVMLHFWIAVFGSGTVWGMRVLSVLGGLIAVLGTFLIGRQMAGLAGGVTAGLAAAFSPIVLLYAQELRAYSWVMAAAGLAVMAAVQAGRADRPRRWLVLATAMSVAVIWLHYSGLVIAAAIAIYVLRTPTIAQRERWAHAVVVAVAFLMVAPLMVLQLRSGHQGGVAPFAKLTLTNLLRVIGTPFDGRFAPQPITYLCGAATVAVAFGVLLWPLRAAPRPRESLLIATVAGSPIVALIVVNVGAWVTNETTYYSLISRYTAVATPFLLAAIGYAIVRGRTLVQVVVVLLVGIASVTGLVGDYSRNTRWPNYAAAFDQINSSLAPGDAVAVAGAPAQGKNAAYYLSQFQRAHPSVEVRDAAQVAHIKAQRVWIVTDAGTAPILAQVLPSEGFAESSVQQFYPDVTLILARPGS